jgi:hypothetical protein
MKSFAPMDHRTIRTGKGNRCLVGSCTISLKGQPSNRAIAFPSVLACFY